MLGPGFLVGPAKPRMRGIGGQGFIKPTVCGA
jgi:hypothetical protein